LKSYVREGLFGGDKLMKVAVVEIGALLAWSVAIWRGCFDKWERREKKRKGEQK
jgi:hypothetical protein